MKLTYLQPDANSPEAYLKVVAKSVGCKTKEEMGEFLNPRPPIHNTISSLPDYKKAMICLKHAVRTQKKIVIFGDYDCDGITALVQLMDVLNAIAGHKKHSWFIPDRMADDYGLTRSGLKRCIDLHNPQLLICVDCGSNSISEIDWLKDKGVECIVIDHHEVVSSNKPHPATAHLNPKAFDMKNPSINKLTMMSASGLAFLFCEQYANDDSITNWNRNRSLLLAGLGTLADVMPLVGINRTLLKHSLRLANDEKELGCIPGLVALKNVSKTGEVNSNTYGFQWGPRLNALGRLEDATISVKLLLSKTLDDAEPLAEKCNEANNKRKIIQEKILTEAIDKATSLVNIHKHKVIILNNKDWHVGVVGIVASKIKEFFNRPAVICGWQEEEDCWKGSGRSILGFDLGEATTSAVKKCILLNGGGHKMACGLSFHNKNLTELRNWMNAKCRLTEEDFVPTYTVLGNMFDQSPEVWVSIYKQLEPFGNGNPKPLLCVSGKLMWSGKNKTKEDAVWSIKAGFRCDNGPDKLIYFTWKNIERARTEWQKGSDYQMVLSVSESVKEYPDGKKIYYNWDVKDCESV
jgi:single-stranded-DNA-specific exonuclease